MNMLLKLSPKEYVIVKEIVQKHLENNGFYVVDFTNTNYAIVRYLLMDLF